MTNVTTVGITNGVPTSGSGNVSTLDGLMGPSNKTITDVVTAIGAPTPAGTNVIGHVVVDSAPSTPVTNAGTFAVQAAATLAAETTKVIGVTRTADGSGNLITSTANAIDVNIKSGSSAGTVAQASTTAGEAGTLVQGAVTTAAPTYTTGQTNPLSLDTTGALRVNVTAGGAGGGVVTQATGSNLHTVVDSGTVAATQSGTWTVQPGNTANTVAWKVDGSAVTQPVSLASVPSHAVTNAGTFAVQVNSALPAGTNVLGHVIVDTAPTTAVTIATAPVLVAGSAIIGKVGIDQTTPGTTNAVVAKVSDGTNTAAVKAASTAPLATDPALVVSISPNSVSAPLTAQSTMSTGFAQVALPTDMVQPNKVASTSNGTTASRVNAAATTNATSLKASAGNLINIDVFNVAAYSVFLKLYNKASSPTVGTDTPVWTIPIAAGTGYSRHFPNGKNFATGVAYAITKLQADSDTTAVAAGDLTGSIDWI